jgi:quercetin dioxygenase-like cupin family protein
MLKVVEIKEGSEIPFFKGVTGKILLWSERLMFFLVEIEVGELVPVHSHPHEQMGICLKGEAEFRGAGKSVVVREGMAYFIPSNEKHGVKVTGIEKGLFLDVFSPPREDYLEKMS